VILRTITEDARGAFVTRVYIDHGSPGQEPYVQGTASTPGASVLDAMRKFAEAQSLAAWQAIKDAHAARMAEAGGEDPPTPRDPTKRYTGEECAACGERVFETPSGSTCVNGHGGAPTRRRGERR